MDKYEEVINRLQNLINRYEDYCKDDPYDDFSSGSINGLEKAIKIIREEYEEKRHDPLCKSYRAYRCIV